MILLTRTVLSFMTKIKIIKTIEKYQLSSLFTVQSTMNINLWRTTQINFSAKASLEVRLNKTIQSLIASVAQRFATTTSRHLCTDGNSTDQLLKSCREQTQYLHHITWDIAVRKVNSTRF